MIYDTLNRPLQALRISVIDACNFRCTYCMPTEDFPSSYQFLKQNLLLSFPEIVRLVNIFTGIGVRRIRLTGGEPLLRKNLADLVAELKQNPLVEDLSLTTNGVFLQKYAVDLKQAGLDRITISLDTLDPKVFHQMNGGKSDVVTVLDGMEAAQQAGFFPMKINVVVQKGVNDHTLLDLVEYFKKSGHTLRFIEYMDVGTRNGWRLEQVVPSKEILQMIHAKYPIETLEENYFGEVAERYRYQDGSAEIGFISSVTQPFCRSCVRGRISADGNFFTCLFASQGKDLRILLRSGKTDAEIKEDILNIWKKRSDRYSEERASLTTEERSREKVEMYRIGG